MGLIHFWCEKQTRAVYLCRYDLPFYGISKFYLLLRNFSVNYSLSDVFHSRLYLAKTQNCPIKPGSRTSKSPLTMDPCVSIPLDDKTLNDIVEKAKDYCLMHGKFKPHKSVRV